jgi:hypothetical protein
MARARGLVRVIGFFQWNLMFCPLPLGFLYFLVLIISRQFQNILGKKEAAHRWGGMRG